MLLWGLHIDPLYVVLFFATLFISGASQLYIRKTFGKWSGVTNSSGLTGVQIGEKLVAGVAMKARAFLVPAVTFSPIASYLLIFVGLIFNLAGLFWLGIIVFGAMVVFNLMTLPVEIGASRRALARR